MKHIALQKRTHENWSGIWMQEDMYDALINETCRITAPDGTLLAVLLKGALLNPDFIQFISVMKTQRWSSNNRGTAAGSGTHQRVKQDGTLSNTTIGDEVESGIFGFFERNPRYPYCRACAFNLKYPEMYKMTLPTLQQVSGLFKQHVPDRWEYQNEFIQKTNKDFIIPATVFTTVTVNRNFRTAAHTDAGDLAEGFTCMSVGVEGLYGGGNLVFPDFGVALKLDHGDLVFFQPHEFHGNTPIRPLTKNYARWSFVHYYRTKMIHCLSNGEELDRVKNRKEGSPLF